MATGNLKEKTAKGLMWGAINNGTMQVLNLLIGIIVLRQLTPEDTGLVGMLAIFTAIAGNLQSSGFSTALINEKQPTAQQYNSVFWFNILMGGLLYVLLFYQCLYGKEYDESRDNHCQSYGFGYIRFYSHCDGAQRDGLLEFGLATGG